MFFIKYIIYLILFFILFGVYRKKGPSLPNGRLFGIFLIALFGIRFLIEFLKNPQVEWETKMPLNMGQLLSIPFILCGVVILYMSYKKKTNTLVSTENI